MKGTSPFQGVEIAGASVDRCFKAMGMGEAWKSAGAK